MSVQETPEEPALHVEHIISEVPPPSFADKLAGYYVAEKGYQFGIPIDAGELLSGADISLSVQDGLTLRIVCIVDGEKHPGKIFGFTADQTRDIAQNYLSYGEMKGEKAKRAVTISVIEIRADPIYERAEELKAFRKTGWFDRRILHSSVISPSSGIHLSSQKVLDQFVASVLARPVLSATDIAQHIKAYDVPAVQPLLTYGLLAFLAVIFGLELLFNIGSFATSGTPSIETLSALGGNRRSLTLGQNEWYRLWMAIILHASVTHLLLNGFALFVAGRILEPILGRLRFFALFMIGGLCGSLASLVWNPANLVSIGASGAITACFGAAIVLALHYPAGRMQSRLISSSIQILIPSMLPFLNFHTGTTIDYADHIGGAIGGALVGGGFLFVWPKDQPRPGGHLAALIAAIIGVVGIAYGAVSVALGYSERSLMVTSISELARASDFLPLWKDALAGGDTLTNRYPRDPRGHLGRSVHLLDTGNFAAAESEAKLALEQKFILEKVLAPVVRAETLGALAIAEAHQGRLTEAVATAAPICGEMTFLHPFLVKEAICTTPK